VRRIQNWRWSSLGCESNLSAALLSDWPVARPAKWAELVNHPVAQAEQERLAVSFQRGRPLGDDAWTLQMAGQMGLQYTLNPHGRPRKSEVEE
jgi:putative transposase